MTKIVGIETFDVRFPTSKMLDGSDAMNQDPDYSGAYLRIKTDSDVHGDSLIFTIGRGNEVQIKALDILAEKVVGLDTADAFNNIGDIARQLSGDSQLRWLGPDYGVFHMGAGGVLNALWDLFAKERKVPLWKLLSDLSPEQVVNAIDFRYITDALNRTQALDILNRQLDYKSSNEAKLRTQGVLAYTTSPGWLGYTDEKMLKLTQEAMDQGFTLLKYKCGKSLEDDKRRLRKVRELVGPDFSIAIDANQVWDVDEAITWINELREFKLRWIEEPTSPTDVVGHAKIAAGVAPTAVATGEMAGSRIIFKQLLQSKGFSVMQIDATRVAGVNENIANILMAAKYSVPVCPHAGGVGLCEMVQHLAMFDAVAVTGYHPGRIVEFVDHLHEHFVVPTDIQNGSYMAPLQPGAGAEMHQASIDKYQFPSGSYWKNGE
jgi:L-fuconate dehydratase